MFKSIFPVLLLTLFVALTPALAADDNSTTSDGAACKPGSSVGYAIFIQPNMSTRAFMKSDYLVKWRLYQVSSPPSFWVLKKVRTTASVLEYITVDDAIPGDATEYTWKIGSALEGSYKLRLVPDGKETYNVAADELPCFNNGEAVPSQSSTFKLLEANAVIVYSDNITPNGAQGRQGHLQWTLAALLVVGVIMSLF